MAVINDVTEVLHRIRVKLYPNYLPQVPGAYIARTDNEASLSIDQVCAALKNRGGFTGNYEDLLEHIRQFFDEAAYQLCDGFAVNMKYFSLHPNVGGTFDAATEAHDHKKHPVGFRFRVQNPLRRLASRITVDIEGVADPAGWIDQFVDTDEDSVNTLYIAGDQFVIHGHKIKVAGEDPSCGVYFVPVADPARAVKVTRIAENSPAKIIGIATTTGHVENKIEIRTQYNGSSTVLKAPRIITSAFTVEES